VATQALLLTHVMGLPEDIYTHTGNEAIVDGDQSTQSIDIVTEDS